MDLWAAVVRVRAGAGRDAADGQEGQVAAGMARGMVKA